MGGVGDKPTTFDDWMRSQQTTTDRFGGQGAMGPAAVVGITDPAWVGGGIPRVNLVNDTRIWVTPISFPAGSILLPNQQVLLTRSALGWHITELLVTAQPFMSQIPVTPLNGWIVYTDNTNNDEFQDYGDSFSNGAASSLGSAASSPIYATITSTGIVSVEGMVVIGTAPASGSVIAQLPVGMRPTRTQLYEGYGSGGGMGVVVTPDGNIRYYSGTPTGYFSLNVIRFRAAGYQTFVPLTLATGFAEYVGVLTTGDLGGAGSHTPGYTLDAHGVVLFEGLLTNTAATAASQNIAQCPALATQLGSHQQVLDTVVQNYARYGGSAGAGGLGNWLNLGNACSAAGHVISLSQMMVAPAPVGWAWQPLTAINAWVSYDASATTWELPAAGKTPDGLVLNRGLWRAGSSATAALYVSSKGWRSRFTAILVGVSNAVLYRLDINLGIVPNSGAATRAGLVSPMATASTAWLSTGGISWPAYQ